MQLMDSVFETPGLDPIDSISGTDQITVSLTFIDYNQHPRST